ncbi:MAG TPA: CBS domain-containing protein [Microbacteriaceae bacterium]|nr:CBS domain-containing protein [Microbacteriaceae bacterium]
MSMNRVFAARVAGCAVFDPNGDRVGRVRDVVVVRRATASPRVVGLVVEVPGKRRVFLSIGRVTSISSGQVIVTGLINLRRFEQRPEEIRIIAEMLGRRVHLQPEGDEARIEDIAIGQTPVGDWEVTQLFVRKPRTGGGPFSFGKGPTAFASWADIRESDERPGEDQDAEHLVESINELLPADAANLLLDLPEKRLVEVAKQLPNERLADLIEEMGEEDQADLIAALGDDRAADVLDEMQPDDAADLIASLPAARGEALLGLMEPEEAEDVRFLLAYEFDTAGGLMSPEPIIVSADATVAEGLALIRRHELAPAMASAVFVTLPPYEPPTGRFLGAVHFQRMLRYPPHERLGALVDPVLEPVNANAGLQDVARSLASYNLVCLPVVDDGHRLVGVVTIDDVLDHLLPDDWRSTDAEPVTSTTAPGKGTSDGAH